MKFFDFHKKKKSKSIEEPDENENLSDLQKDFLNVVAKKWTINDDRINVEGDLIINFVDKKFFIDGKLPVKFGTVRGKFECTYIRSLETLDEFPTHVTDSVYISFLPLIKNLKNMPQDIGGNVRISSIENLTSLEGMPEYLNGDFSIRNCNKLENLIGCSKSVKELNIPSNDKISSLKGCPEVRNGCINLMFLPNLEDFSDITLGNYYMLRHTIDNTEFIEFASKTQNNTVTQKVLKAGFTDVELWEKWLASDLKLTSKEFREQKRGYIASKKFGF